METIDTLNKLITRNYDAEKGFEAAAEKTDNNVLKEYFTKNSKMHYKFGHEIKDEIKKRDGKIDKGTSLAGDIHRGWLNFKTALAGGSDEELIKECERGQKIALEDYQEAVDHAESTELSTIIANQKAEIVDVVEELKALAITS